MAHDFAAATDVVADAIRRWCRDFGIPDSKRGETTAPPAVPRHSAAKLSENLCAEFGLRVSEEVLVQPGGLEQAWAAVRDYLVFPSFFPSRAAVSGHPRFLSIRSGTGTPFFCVHADFGEPVALYALPLRGIERPILGIRAAGLVGDETVPNTVEAMAGRYADDIVAVQPTGPYVVGGYCIGGIVALEVARRLGDVERVILLDSFPPGTLLQPHVSASEAADLKALQRDSVLSRSFSAGPSVASWLRRRQDEIWRNNVLLTFGYQNQPVDFPISLIQSSNEALASYAQDYWRAVAGGRLDVYGIDTVHDDFIQSTEAGAVLRRLLTPLVPGSGE